jgi:hypothetical protein
MLMSRLFVGIWGYFEDGRNRVTHNQKSCHNFPDKEMEGLRRSRKHNVNVKKWVSEGRASVVTRRHGIGDIVKAWSYWLVTCSYFVKFRGLERVCGPNSVSTSHGLFALWLMVMEGSDNQGTSLQAPSRAEVTERVELYLYFPFGPSWPVLWWTFTLLEEKKFLERAGVGKIVQK